MERELEEPRTRRRGAEGGLPHTYSVRTKPGFVAVTLSGDGHQVDLVGSATVPVEVRSALNGQAVTWSKYFGLDGKKRGKGEVNVSITTLNAIITDLTYSMTGSMPKHSNHRRSRHVLYNEQRRCRPNLVQMVLGMGTVHARTV